jgi:hypothetical protein
MTRDELLALPVTVGIETAGRALGIGRANAYALAKRDEFPVPVLRIGCRYRVVTAELHRVLGLDQETVGAVPA